MKGRVGGVLEELGNRQNQVKALFFGAQPNERLSIVGHLDAFSIKIKKTPPAHAKHGNQTPKTNTTKTQHTKPKTRQVQEAK